MVMEVKISSDMFTQSIDKPNTVITFLVKKLYKNLFQVIHEIISMNSHCWSIKSGFTPSIHS